MSDELSLKKKKSINSILSFHKQEQWRGPRRVLTHAEGKKCTLTLKLMKHVRSPRCFPQTGPYKLKWNTHLDALFFFVSKDGATDAPDAANPWEGGSATECHNILEPVRFQKGKSATTKKSSPGHKSGIFASKTAESPDNPVFFNPIAFQTLSGHFVLRFKSLC